MKKRRGEKEKNNQKMWPISVYLTAVNKKLRSVAYLTSQVRTDDRTRLGVPRQTDEVVPCVGVGIFLCQKPFSFPSYSVWVSVCILTQYYGMSLSLACHLREESKH